MNLFFKIFDMNLLFHVPQFCISMTTSHVNATKPTQRTLGKFSLILKNHMTIPFSLLKEYWASSRWYNATSHGNATELTQGTFGKFSLISDLNLICSWTDCFVSEVVLITRFFYRQHFYKQHRAKTGKKLSKRQTCFWQTYQSRFACVIEKIDHMLYLIDVKLKIILER